MKKEKNHKQVPLQTSQTDIQIDIEKKVDDILLAHTKMVARKRRQERLLNYASFDEKKQPSLFYIASTKKTKTVKKSSNKPQSKDKHHLFIAKTPSTTKKPHLQPSIYKKNIKQTGERKKGAPSAVVGLKKRIQLQKQRIEITTKKQNLIKTPQKTEDPLPVFEESIAQIKQEEAEWLDDQIKASTKAENPIQSPKTDFEDTENALPPEDDATQQLQDIENESVILKNQSNTFPDDPDDLPVETTASHTEVLLKQEVMAPEQTESEDDSKIDDIVTGKQIKYFNEANQLKASTLERMGYLGKDIEEIDFYPIYEPFAYVEIIRENESLDKRYVLLEMQLTKDEEYLLKYIQDTLNGYGFKTSDLELKGESQYLREKVDLILEEYMLYIDSLTKEKLLYYLEKESIGLGKLEVIMKDPNIEDISCDGSGVFIFLYHRLYGSLKSNVQFSEEDELTAFVVKLAQKCGKHISISEPMLDATMPDGSRIQMTLSTEVTTKGSTFTIRKFSEDPFSPPDLIEFHTMSSEMVAYMWLAVENGINALIAGGTAAGKTSTLNALCLFIPRESKIVSIEETREINLPHPNWIPGVVRSGFGEIVGNKVIGEIDLYDLMKAALRQRPEYILVGEIRGKEAYVLFQAMATGHTTYSTVHADSAQSLIHRLEGKPIEIPRIMLQTLDIVIIQVISRVKNKRARRCKQIIEIIDIDPTTKEILTNEVFRWDPIEDKFVYSGKSYVLERIRGEKDISREGMISEIKNRTMLLDWMNRNNIREFKKVATIIAKYVDNPGDVMKTIRNE